MEESEKRRERLRAMRMEAAQVEVGSNAENLLGPSSLSNPLLGNSGTHPVEKSYATPRFDFYTDPMSAFSANKNKGQQDNQITQDYFPHLKDSTSVMARPPSSLPGPRNPEITPPSHQLQNSSSFGQRMYQAQGPYNSNAAYGSPRGMVSPLPPHQGTPEASFGSTAMTNYYTSASHSYRSPRGMVSPFPMMHQGPPEAWNGSGGTASYNSPSNASGGGQLYSPGFGFVRSPNFNHGQGRPYWRGNSPSPGSGRGGSHVPSSGRGRGHQYGANMSQGSGHGGGRGRGFHSRGSEPECFYHKSMDENPWERLQPIVWKRRSSKSPSSSNSWLPKSISTKKPRVSEASNRSSSQPSLAEYLAASFNEAINDASSS
ncbi:hypothetical protein ACOSP7_010317 [Xanthoceras sorbifolium]|uniref:Uncharacterized protein n=1 Tax=Xanthoceras sorbifolium TaxID=99658 RepID=A0ABQ8HTE4_9ROSI|nr:hypothetical protein JRO89_XS07G0113700 [Xanthoceras sorbifolium]